MTEAPEIKQAQEHLATTQKEVKRIETVQQQTQDEISRLEWHINQLEDQLPALAAQFKLREIEKSTLDEHVAKIEMFKRQATISTAATEGLEPRYNHARKAMKQAGDALSKEENRQRFEQLKTQLLEKYDEKLLAKARRVANNIGHTGAHWHAYDDLVRELEKRNHGVDIQG